MEDKQLNFNRPLLSVRTRYPTVTSQKDDKRENEHSTPAVPRPPLYRSELKSGPVSNPGAVPFLWEHTPGQPKEEKNRQIQKFKKPPIAPKLPPGRKSKANEPNSQKEFPSTNEEKVEKVENSKEVIEEESCDSVDSDAPFVDALDTLSRNESFFLNCSMSGVSGMDGSDLKPFGSFSTDSNTREFMMDRFLPAAKAMANDMPNEYAPKKQTLVQEKSQNFKKMVNQEKPSLRYGPSFAKRYSYYQENDEEESDDEYEKILPGICGLVPRFCLNPIPITNTRSRVLISRADKTRPRSSSGGSCSENENERKSDITELKSGNKRPKSFLEEKKVVGLHSKTFQEFLADLESSNEIDLESPVVEKTLYIDTIQKVETNNFLNKMMDQVNLIEDFKKVDFMGGEKRGLDVNSYVTENIAMSKKEALTEGVEKVLSKAIVPFEEFLVPPPLPKSPSDSWLSRTLPSVSTKKLTRRSYLGTNPQNLCLKASTGDVKWETMVKTTNVQRHHLRYSEELLTPIPET